jgi:hypothetical protein
VTHASDGRAVLDETSRLLALSRQLLEQIGRLLERIGWRADRRPSPANLESDGSSNVHHDRARTEERIA